MNNLHLDQIIEHGCASDGGNLLGIMPYMLPVDYTSPDALLNKLKGYFQAAREKGWLNQRTIVVLPEYLGTWLVAAGEHPGIYTAETMQAAMRMLVLRHPLRFVQAYRTGKARDRVTEALFRMKAEQMTIAYGQVMVSLAKNYRVTIVGGSILLPEPEVVDGSIRVGSGPLQNMSAVFKPDGSIYPQLSRKICPIDAELPFIAAAPVEHLPVFETEVGCLGVLVCADSWYPAPYQDLAAKGVDLLAVPSFAAGYGLWNSAWGGYNGAATPAGVDAADIGRLTERQAWRKYALAGRIRQSGARAGINVFLRGRLWDAGSDSGETLAICGDDIIETSTQGAALLNLWL